MQEQGCTLLLLFPILQTLGAGYKPAPAVEINYSVGLFSSSCFIL